MAPGTTIRTPAASTAAAPRAAQRKPRDQARRDVKRVLRLMLTRRFYGYSSPRSYPRFWGAGCGSPRACSVTSTYRRAGWHTNRPGGGTYRGTDLGAGGWGAR